jgi:hypothetical protein
MAGTTIRGTRGSTVLVVSALLHGREAGKVRECPHCHAKWSILWRGSQPPQVWKNDLESPSSVLDWAGNNAAIECCAWPREAG